MRRSRALAALGAALLAGSLGGCDDDSGKAAAAAAAQAKAEAEATLASVEQNANDPSKFAQVMHDIGKARVQAFGENTICDRLDQAAVTARKAREKQLESLWSKVDQQGKDALSKSEPEASDKACAEALAALDRLAPGVLAHAGTKADELRAQLMDRAEAARRATEIMAKAKEMKESDENARARALLRSFEVVPSFKASPFGGKVLAMLAEIPEKPAGGGAGDADWLTIFDGSSDLQFNYFDRQHDWTWKLEDNVLLGDNTESSEDSTLWLGDETWGDLLVSIQFNMGDVGMNFRARQKDEAFDVLPFSIGSGFDKDTWYSVKIEIKGSKMTMTRDDGPKQVIELANPKGKIGFTLPGMSRVKVREIKIKLLDKDAKKPVQKAPETIKKEDPDPKKKKKKKKPGEPDKKPEDEKKPDDAKKPEGDK